MDNLNVSISMDLSELLDLKHCIESTLDIKRKLNYSAPLIDQTTALLDKVQAAIDQWWKQLEEA